jgi:hypothetical protein
VVLLLEPQEGRRTAGTEARKHHPGINHPRWKIQRVVTSGASWPVVWILQWCGVMAESMNDLPFARMCLLVNSLPTYLERVPGDQLRTLQFEVKPCTSSRWVFTGNAGCSNGGCAGVNIGVPGVWCGWGLNGLMTNFRPAARPRVHLASSLGATCQGSNSATLSAGNPTTCPKILGSNSCHSQHSLFSTIGTPSPSTLVDTFAGAGVGTKVTRALPKDAKVHVSNPSK